MPRTIVHIGMPRAASTFFQKAFFPFVKGFRYVGVDNTQYSEHFQKLLYQDESLYRAGHVSAAIETYRDANLILSNELFVGQSLYMAGTNRSRTAERLAALFPDAEILLVLRNQADLLQSLYAIGVYSGHTMPPKDFVRFATAPSEINHPLYPTFAPAEITELYTYTHLIALYQRLFKKVHVLLYEDFAENPEAFLASLAQKLDFSLPENTQLGQKVNRSLSARQLYFIKILNRWKPLINRGRLGKGLFGMKMRFVEKRMGGGRVFAFDQALRAKIQTEFRSDNLALPAMLPELEKSENFKRWYLG